MPTNDDRIVKWIKEHTAGCKLVVDLGCGYGNYTRCVSGRKIGIDIWPEYEEVEGLTAIVGDMLDYRQFVETPFACAMLIDSLEHVSHDHGESLLRSLQNDCDKILVFAPIGMHEQAGTENPYQEHLAAWYPDELRRMGFVVETEPAFHKDNSKEKAAAMFAIWNKP